jgi:TIR domain
LVQFYYAYGKFYRVFQAPWYHFDANLIHQKNTCTITLFISYHPDDSATLLQLLEWLEPFRYKFYLRIYYNRYDQRDADNLREYTENLHNANVYLYLISQKWLQDRRIQQNEVDAIIERMHTAGKDWVHLMPVQVKPCQWRNFSKLVELEDIALPLPKQELTKIDPRDTGFLYITDRLTSIIEPLRNRLIEEAKLKGLPIEQYYTFTMTPKERAPRRGAIRFSLEDLKSWAYIGVVLFLIWALYQVGCNAEPFR